MLPDIQEKVERSIYHAIRKVAEQEGYIPAISDYSDIVDPADNQASSTQTAYEEAIKNIVTSMGFAVEIFNSSNNQSKGTKKVPRIVLETTAFYQGELGLDTTERYVKEGETFNQVMSGESLVSDYNFNIRLIYTSTKQSRILHGIMVKALPRRGYIKWYDEDSLRYAENIHIRFISSSEISWLSEGIIEKVFRYEVKDLHETDDIIVREGISPIKEIEVNTTTGDNINSDSMVIS